MTIPNWLSPNSIIKKFIHDFLYSRDDLLLFLIILFYWKMFNFLPKITPLYFFKNKASCVQGVTENFINWKSVKNKVIFFSFIYLKRFCSNHISLYHVFVNQFVIQSILNDWTFMKETKAPCGICPYNAKTFTPGSKQQNRNFQIRKNPNQITRLYSLFLSPVGGGILLPFPQVTVSSFLPVYFSFYTTVHVLRVICMCTNGWYCSSERISRYHFFCYCFYWEFSFSSFLKW